MHSPTKSIILQYILQEKRYCDVVFSNITVYLLYGILCPDWSENKLVTTAVKTIFEGRIVHIFPLWCSGVEILNVINCK